MKVKVIYGSEFGTTKYIAELFEQELKKFNHEVQVIEVGSNNKPSFDGADLFLIGSPTYYGNRLGTNMDEFTNQFSGSLKNVQLAIFAVGDSGYPNFCGAAETLKNWATTHEATLLGEPLKLDGYPKDVKVVSDWLAQVIESFKK